MLANFEANPTKGKKESPAEPANPAPTTMHQPMLANKSSFRLTLAFAPLQPFPSRCARCFPSKSRVLRFLRTLFLSLHSFRRSPRLFSATCGLFLQNTGGWGTSATSPRLPLLQAGLCVIICFFCRPFIFINLQIPPHRASICNALCFHAVTNPFFHNFFVFTSIQTPGCGIQIMVNHRLSHDRPGGGSFFRAIKEFDSYERNFALESDCWSIIRATNRAAQPREIRPNTRVKTKAVTGRSPKPAAGGVAATKGGSQQNESDPGFLARHTRSRIPRRCGQSWHPRT